MRISSVRSIVVVIALASIPVLAGCRNDGRTLRPAGPGQTTSISTASTSPGTDFALPDLTDDGSTAPSGTGVRTVTAPWPDGGEIDPAATCDGDNLSPALAWGPPPAATAEIAISMSDLDAPDFIHWIVAGIDPTTAAIGEGDLPVGAVEATNSRGDLGYTGPCPPAGTTHTYLITVHYLGEESGLSDGDTGQGMLARIRNTVIATAEVTGTYSRG